MANVNYAQLYHQAVQQAFYGGLYFQALYNSPNNSTIKFINAKTIQIPKVSVGGFTDVDRDVVTSFTRRADNSWETKTLEHDREFSTLVDPVDIDETNMALSIANITRVFNTEQKIPEMDKYAASKLFTEFGSYGGTANTDAIDAQNVLDLFDEFMMEMDDAEVPQTGRILYVTPQVNKLLKEAEGLQRRLDVIGGGAKAVNRNIYSLDDVNIVTVPSSRMKTAYDFTSGAEVDESAQQINMIMVHPQAILTPQQYEFVSLDNPSAKTGGKYLYYERKYWDLFALENRVNGIKFHVEGTSTP